MPTSAEVFPYLDASALVKLVIPEPESRALRRYLHGWPLLASCALARAELLRAVGPHGADAVQAGRALLAELDLVELDEELLDLAGTLDGELRSLDAIHVAAASEFGNQLEAFVTYDRRMVAAATALGLRTVSPA